MVDHRPSLKSLNHKFMTLEVSVQLNLSLFHEVNFVSLSICLEHNRVLLEGFLREAKDYVID